MSEAYEVIFERVCLTHVHGLIRFIVDHAKGISDLSVSGTLEDLELETYEQILDAVVNHPNTACFMAIVHQLEVSESVCLGRVLLSVLKYEGGIDVELSFDNIFSGDVEYVMAAMHKYAAHLAGIFRLQSFYGGLEPAIDKDTRYFTGNCAGPL